MKKRINLKKAKKLPRNLNVYVNPFVMRRGKARAALLGLKLNNYVERLISLDTEKLK